jgi:hypothetical protein
MEKILQQCIKICKDYQWVLIAVGAVLLVLGFILDAALVKSLWMLVGIVLIVAGGFGVYTGRTKTK